MNLYELTDGYLGESYTRCYAWAEDEEQARALYKHRHPDGRPICDIKLLMAGDCAAFVTDISDCGWER